jgi:hypothetical protein
LVILPEDVGPTLPDGNDQPPPLGVLALTRQRGYQYHVFISWPHQIEAQGRRIALALKEGLENKFRNWGGGSVFLDESEVDAFHLWDQRIRRALARSAVTLVLLVDTYFLSNYCRLEWAITEQLQEKRLPPATDATCFYHILLDPSTRLPQEVRALTPSPAFQKLLIFGRKPERHAKWPQLISELAEKVRTILTRVCEASPPQWEEHERIALAAQAQRFAFGPPAPASPLPLSMPPPLPSAPLGLPRFSVETFANGR